MITPVQTQTAESTADRIYKIYMSSAAFMIGPLVATSKNSSCPRFLWAQAHSGLSKDQLRSQIADEYQALGALDEWRYSAKLDKEKVKYQREVPFQIEYKNTVISGRMDFVLEDGTIIEKKSTTSEYMYKTVFEQGEPDKAHMAQLVSYLSFLKQPTGRLVVSYYELSDKFDAYEIVAEKEFTAQVQDNVILIDGAEYKHSIKDLARFYALLQSNLSTVDTVPAKPVLAGPEFQHPCNFCPLKKICKEDKEAAQFLQESTQALLLRETPRSFKIQRNSERRKQNRQNKKDKQQ